MVTPVKVYSVIKYEVFSKNMDQVLGKTSQQPAVVPEKSS